MGRLARRYDSFVLERLRVHAPVPTEASALAAWAEMFTADLNTHGLLNGRYSVQAKLGGADHSGAPLLAITRHQHGAEHTVAFNEDFFAGGDYRRLVAFNAIVQPLAGAGGTIKRGNRELAVASFTEAYDWLMKEASRGLHIQRYKGLGEMNPEQLHETTLDPLNRRLVKVGIEDAIAADLIFTTLMGEDVEPRREFIEKHALLVGNLDV